MNPQSMPDRPDVAGAEPAKRKSPLRLIVVLVIVALAVLLIVQNHQSATVSFFGWGFTMPGWLWILILVLLGVIIGSVFPWGRRKRKAAKS
jgi:uncharacterized integral membrane protein